MLKLLEKKEIDIIFTDINMPVLDEQHYMEILLETLELLKGSTQKMSQMVSNDEYHALKEFAWSVTPLYKNIHAPEMVKMFDELIHYLSERNKMYLMEYAVLYQKNWMNLKREIDSFVAYVKEEA